jgi:S1-C subfamily serine protease
VAAVTTWSPIRPQYPRYLITGDVSREGTSFRPVFVGALYAVQSSIWTGSIWALPPSTNLSPGAFVFTTEGLLAGLVVRRDRGLAIVPGDTVLGAADHLRRNGFPEQGQLGIDVEPVRPDLGASLGAETGVIVAWVDPQGPAAGRLDVTDVIEAVGDEGSLTYEGWRARMARLAPGESVLLHVRQHGNVRTVSLTAGPAPPAAVRPLGLTLRAIRSVGVEVVRVDLASAAARAGIEPGDVITLIGDRQAPTPSEVRRVFAAAPEDRPILLAVTRGERHQVLVLQKR